MKIDLAKDQRKARKYLLQRIKDYPLYVNVGPGDDEDPISLITVGFYATQGGYMNLVFDTRPNTGPSRGFDGEWTVFMGDEPNLFEFPSWNQCFETLYEGKSVTIKRHDFKEVEILPTYSSSLVNMFFGDMLVDLVMKMRNEGHFRKLPLAVDARIAIEEFDGEYFWPMPEKESFSDKKAQDSICRMGRLN